MTDEHEHSAEQRQYTRFAVLAGVVLITLLLTIASLALWALSQAGQTPGEQVRGLAAARHTIPCSAAPARVLPPRLYPRGAEPALMAVVGAAYRSDGLKLDDARALGCKSTVVACQPGSVAARANCVGMCQPAGQPVDRQPVCASLWPSTRGHVHRKEVSHATASANTEPCSRTHGRLAIDEHKCAQQIRLKHGANAMAIATARGSLANRHGRWGRRHRVDSGSRHGSYGGQSWA